MSLKRLWSILKARNLEFFRDRSAFGWNFLFPFLLVAAQPDLGSALTLIPIAAAVLFLAGFPLRYFALIQ